MLYQTIKILTLVIVVICGNILSITAQGLPDEAVLPDGKGAWAVDQNFKTNIAAGGYLVGYIRVIILSDGKVFHRKSFDNGQPATPWCQDKFTAEEMRGIRGAVANSKPTAWDASYGPFISILGPFKALIITMRNSNGKIVEYKTTLWRFYDLPADIAKIGAATDTVGDLAFSNCAKTLPNNEPIIDKIENGATMYAVDSKGDLLWYNHSGFQNGEPTWANNGAGKNVGNGWADNLKVFKANPNGKDKIVYTVSQEGWLSWYKHNGYASGSSDWETPKNVGIGFNGQHVFSGGNGVIYLIDKAGEIYWYKHLGYQTGEKTWLNNGVGKKIEAGWNDARHVFSGGDGIIYKIDSQGDLYWSKHLGFQDGTAKWSEQKKVGSGWQNLRQVFSGGNGIINAVKNDGTLLWQKHNGFATGTVLWANNGAAKTIGSGWNFNFVF